MILKYTTYNLPRETIQSYKIKISQCYFISIVHSYSSAKKSSSQVFKEF